MSKNKLKIIKVLSGITLTFLFVMFGEYIYFKNRVPLGVFIGNYYLGGKTYNYLDFFLEKLKEELEKGKINLYISAEESPLNFTLEEKGIKLHKEKIMEEAIALNTPFNYKKKIELYLKRWKMPAYYKIDEKKFISVLQPLKEKRYIPPQDAHVRAEGGKLIFIPHRKGKGLKIKKIKDRLLEELSSWPAFPLTLHVEREDLHPEVEISHLLKRGIIDKISMAVTYFNTKDINRSHNITLAAGKVDNTILAPGEIFSFNQIVGEASLEEGFREAPVIVNDRLVLGPGGGICQVSSTIYNAALKAGLSIVERHNHGLPVGYLPPGYDATVAYNYRDLKFMNDTSFYILIHLQISDSELSVTFFGDPSRTKEVEIITKSIQVIDPPVHYRELKDHPISYKELIQKGHPGYIVETTRIFYENGEEVYRESLGKNYYSPTPKVYAVGVLPEN